MSTRTKGQERKVRRVKRRVPASFRREDLQPICMELFGTAVQVLEQYGLNRTQQRALFSRALGRSAFEPASAQHLNSIRPLGDLMAAWREERPYVDEGGKPRVLPLVGRIGSFQTLAKRFFPALSWSEVLQLVCRFGHVGRVRGQRVALYGDTVVDLSKAAETGLAQTVIHFRQIAATCLHNQGRKLGNPGFTERIVAQPVSREAFEHYLTAFRSQLHDVCERADRGLKPRAQPKRRGRPAVRGMGGIGVYAYFDEEGTACPGAKRGR